PPPLQLYPLSLHDALPILTLLVVLGAPVDRLGLEVDIVPDQVPPRRDPAAGSFGHDESASGSSGCTRGATSSSLRYTSCDITGRDRKSTRLNSSHVSISYA